MGRAKNGKSTNSYRRKFIKKEGDDLKPKFFSKMNARDYNNQLEMIIQEKKISTTGKNLLLSMLYKIEANYPDYAMVKQNHVTRDECLQEILKIIQEKCDKLLLVEPKSKKGMVLARYKVNSVVNSAKKEIISYPTEKAILYALYDLAGENYFISDAYDWYKTAFQKMLRVGGAIQAKEILRDFNGWSWDIDTRDIEHYSYNLLYQNLRILVGERFFYQWRNDQQPVTNYLELLKKLLQENMGEKYGLAFYHQMLKLCLWIYLLENPDVRKKIPEERAKLQEKQILMGQKTRFLDQVTAQKLKLNRAIEKLDKLLHDSEKMQKLLESKNAKRKNPISMKELRLQMKKKRQDLLKALEDYTEWMNPQKFEDNRRKLGKQLTILKSIREETIQKQEVEEQILALQKEFLNGFKIKIQNAKEKEEILDLMYQMRYYKLIPWNAKTKMEQHNELSQKIAEVEDILLVKACNLKYLRILSRNGNYNLEMLKSILSSKVIQLENLEIELKKGDYAIQIEIYDDKNLENNLEIQTSIPADRIDMKVNRKMKLFLF